MTSVVFVERLAVFLITKRPPMHVGQLLNYRRKSIQMKCGKMNSGAESRIGNILESDFSLGLVSRYRAAAIRC